VRIGHLADVDVFVTDRPPPEAVADYCRTQGVALEIADGLNAHELSKEAAQ
jgi:DeoR family glycerol-3-phosphate regulon repressor